MKDSDHKDVYAINRIGPGKCQLTWETVDVHSCGVYNNGMLDLDAFVSIEVTQGLSKSDMQPFVPYKNNVHNIYTAPKTGLWGFHLLITTKTVLYRVNSGTKPLWGTQIGQI